MHLNITLIPHPNGDSRDYIALCRAEADLVSKSGVGAGTQQDAAMQAVRSYFTHRENAERASKPEPFIAPEVPPHPADAYVNPPADSIFAGGSAPVHVLAPVWAHMTPRERVKWAISNGQEIEVTYTSAHTDETTTRRVKPLSFEGEGFMEKVRLLDAESDYVTKQFFVKGIDGVDQVTT